MLKAAGLVLKKTYSKKMANISLSNYTIKTPIDKLAMGIECQVFKKLPTFFLIQCHKATLIRDNLLAQVMIAK